MFVSISLVFAASPKAAARTPEKPGAVPLTAADCHALIAALNEVGKLVPEAALPNVRLRELKASDCQGVRLAGGKRVVLHHPKDGTGIPAASRPSIAADRNAR